MPKISFLRKKPQPETNQKVEEVFFTQIQEYIQNRIIWLMRDLNRNEGFDVWKVEELKKSIEKKFLEAVTKSMDLKENPSEQEKISLRQHIQKMWRTLNKQWRFSPTKNPSDRALISHIIDIILKDSWVKRIRWDNTKKQRELA